ncbi:hypothetical protein SCHPADRAFT_867773 [Schizopora paradoxa]|uniref:Myb/SANT-like domain-containing protein n=1 Tax=Schizopora paradoxa TaxID=27342 RepID=A0A0H2RZZ1_9AGAM|nr:hypothetical protein SCHPADRAFT_867773 [Schizopora paradoxa]
MADEDEDMKDSAPRSKPRKRNSRAQRSKKQETSMKKGQRAPRVVWSSKEDEVLVGELTRQRLLGKQSDNGWKGVVWSACSEKILTELETVKPPDACKGRWRTLKSNYLTVKELLHKSGSGWNDAKKVIEASSDAWADWIKSDSKVESWRDKRFPLYNEIGNLVDGAHATGEAAISISETQQMENPSQETQTSPSEGEDVGLLREENSTDVASSPGASSDERSAVLTTDKRTRGRPTGPMAVMDVADALRDVANSFKNSEDIESTPLRRIKAVRAVEEDNTLSPTTQQHFMGLISKTIGIADVYMAIKNEDTRAGFVHDSLQR